jgi:hypothetical protein
MNPFVQEIPLLEKNPEDVYVLHACFTKSTNTNHFSQRIVCLYLQNLNGSHSEKFSIEKYASKNNIALDGIEDWYDDLEIYVLDAFNSFLQSKSGSTFIYWLDEGQELVLDIIKARFEELNKESTSKVFQIVPSSNRKSIQYLMKRVSEEEVPDDLKLFIKNHNNQQLIASYLSNGEESICFTKKEFNKIGSSIISKVSFFIKLINNLSKVQAKTGESKTITPIDLQSMRLIDILRNLNVKSWLFLFGLASVGYATGYAITSFTKKSEIESLQKNIGDLEIELKQKSTELGEVSSTFKDSVKLLNENILTLEQALKEVRRDSAQKVVMESPGDKK